MKFIQVVLLCALFWIHTGCAQRGIQDSTTANDTDLLYVTNQDGATVSIIDMTTNEVVETIDLKTLGFSENAKPHHVAVEPDGSFWYVTLIGENKILKFNPANEIVAHADFEVPGMLALHPTEDRMFVGRSMTAVNPPQSIGIIRRSDMSLEEIGVFFPRPHALVVDPRGDYSYTASLAQNQIASVDAATEAVDLVSMNGPVHTLVQFTLSPDGNTLVGSAQLTNQVLIFDTSTPLQPVLVDSIRVDSMPWDPVYSLDGHHVYVGSMMQNTISVLDIPNRKVVKVIEGHGIAEPHGAAISPDGRYVYITNSNMKGSYTPREQQDHQMAGHQMDGGNHHMIGTIVVIDTETNEMVKVIEVGLMPTGINTRLAR
jgi:YVTN family beta-propeller protein